MPGAARVGDMTSHGTPLAPLGPTGGSPNVLIGGLPAWRMSDAHACPLATGAVAHVGGAVVKGSLTVLINGSPAVRENDAITESGPPNRVTKGCPNVSIGG
jgi:uncharacterized Zn-binding protein involved in type VI secretion